MWPARRHIRQAVSAQISDIVHNRRAHCRGYGFQRRCSVSSGQIRKSLFRSFSRSESGKCPGSVTGILLRLHVSLSDACSAMNRGACPTPCCRFVGISGSPDVALERGERKPPRVSTCVSESNRPIQIVRGLHDCMHDGAAPCRSQNAFVPLLSRTFAVRSSMGRQGPLLGPAAEEVRCISRLPACVRAAGFPPEESRRVH